MSNILAQAKDIGGEAEAVVPLFVLPNQHPIPPPSSQRPRGVGNKNSL